MVKIFQRVLSATTAVAMALCASSSSLQVFTREIKANAVESQVIYGDVNGDKKVNIIDLSLIKKSIINPSTVSIDFEASDVNGDGIIDSRDVREIQQFLLCRSYSFSATTRKSIESIDCNIVTTNQPIETSLTAEMAEKTKELGSAIAVYNYLYNNMQSQFYYGSRKGAIGAFEQGGGNDIDLSSLLVAMLRYLGYDANYVSAIAGFTEDQLLKWTNTNSIEVAESIYTMQGREHTTYDFNGVTYYLCDYKYVQLVEDGKTYYLDVYFKDYESQKTVYDAIDSSYSSSNVKKILDDVDVEQLDKEISESQNAIANLENKNYAFNSRKIVQKTVKSLPTETQHSHDIEPTVSENISDSESDIVKIGFSTSKQTSYRTSELYHKNITVSYEVSSASKELADMLLDVDTSSIFNLPTSTLGQAMSVTPVLKVDGVAVLYGAPLEIGNTQTLYITSQTGGTTQNYEESLTAGEMCSIVFDMGKISANELGNAYAVALKKTEYINQKNKFTADISNDNLNENNVYSSDYFGSLLRLTGVMYFAQMDVLTQALAERNDIYSESTLRFGVFGFKPDVYVPNSIQLQNDKNGIQKQGQYFVDILSNSTTNISKTNNICKLEAFNFSRGLISSELESTVLEEILNIKGVSTVSIFRYAQENGISLVTLSSKSEKKVSDLNINSEDASRIQEELNNGNIVITTQSSVKMGNWSGIGYIVMTSDGSTQWYKISGGYSGGITFDPIGLYYAINVALDLTMSVESITALMGILAGISTLTVVPVTLFIVGVLGTSLLVFDIIEQSCLYCEYEFQNNLESGMQIWFSTQCLSVTTLATMGVGKGINFFKNLFIESKLARIYGETTIKAIKETGFSIAEINSRVKKFQSIGLSQLTIDTLLQNSKSMYLDDDILMFLRKQGKNQQLLAKIILSNNDNVTNALLRTQYLDEFCDLFSTYKNSVVNVLLCGDEAIKFVNGYSNASDLIDCFKTGNVIGIDKLSGAKSSTVFTFATTSTGETFVAGSGNYKFNPTITVPEGYFDDLSEYTGSNYYYEKYNNLLTKDYIDSMNVEKSIKDELHILRNAIEYTKSEAYSAGKLYTYGSINEPSFTPSHSVSNCGEIWSAREAILKGAKFKELSFQSVYRSSGSHLGMCDNCQCTFLQYLNLLGEM